MGFHGKDRICDLLNGERSVLSIYLTADYPHLNDTVPMIRELESLGVDMVEIGIPFSDPLADGPIIQETGTVALRNGMTLELLFDQLANIRDEISLPLILMGYLNPVLQFGVERFCKQCSNVGIDGIILPDLPLEEYEGNYRQLFQNYGLKNIFLITPQTSEDRIRQIDEASNGFIYMVSVAGTTGSKLKVQDQIPYFKRIDRMNLKTPRLIGFGINDQETFEVACTHSEGGIVGSGFLKALGDGCSVKDFIKKFKQ